LLGNPALALMDEPFQSIGQAAKSTIIEFIKRRYPNLSILMVTHSLEEIPLLTDSVYYFVSNQLVTPSKLNSFDFQSLFSGLLNPAPVFVPSH
jgi:ABC-type molybdate transport system ATPase subunit